MAKFQSPLLGYNNNVRHKNRVFHIQTEDSGVTKPHIITHLFMDGGRILKSVKKSYAEHVGSEGMSETVRGLMKEQHKAMFIALRDGQFDALVEGGTAPAQKPGSVAPPARGAESVAPPPMAPAAVASPPIMPPPMPPAPGLGSPTVPAPARESRFPAPGSIAPPPASAHRSVAPAAVIHSRPQAPRLELSDPDEAAPSTTRQPPETRPDAMAASKPSPDLMLDFDALDQAAQEGLAAAPLFHGSDLPPPPKNLLAKEPVRGGAYRAVEANLPHEGRHDPREEPPSSAIGTSPRPGRVAPATASRPPEARYAPARPAAIFGSAQRPAPHSIFSDELVSDKSLDEVILSYLAEDLEPPRRK